MFRNRVNVDVNKRHGIRMSRQQQTGHKHTMYNGWGRVRGRQVAPVQRGLQPAGRRTPPGRFPMEL